MRYRIYLDILFLINFGMDAWILWLTGKLCRKHPVWWRQLIAALAGAFLVTILVWIPAPKAWIYTVLGYGVTGLFMCWLAFSPHSVWEMVKSYLCMLGVTFLLGGIMNWLYLETGLGTYIKKLCTENGLGLRGLTILVIASGAIFGILGTGAASIREEWQNPYYQVILCWKDNRIQGRGLLDTGNFLIDPISHRPVILAEAKWFRTLLSQDYESLVQTYLDTGRIDYDLIAERALSGIRWIPYRSVGKEQGELLGIICDAMIIKQKHLESIHRNVVIAISPTPLSGDGRYQLLLQKKIIEWEETVCCR